MALRSFASVSGARLWISGFRGLSMDNRTSLWAPVDRLVRGKSSPVRGQLITYLCQSGTCSLNGSGRQYSHRKRRHRPGRCGSRRRPRGDVLTRGAARTRPQQPPRTTIIADVILVAGAIAWGSLKLGMAWAGTTADVPNNPLNLLLLLFAGKIPWPRQATYSAGIIAAALVLGTIAVVVVVTRLRGRRTRV